MDLSLFDEQADLSLICRLCKQCDENLMNIFDNSKTDSILAQNIMACVRIEVLYNDNGSKKICQKCLENINNWVSFKKICDSSNTLLDLIDTNFEVEQLELHALDLTRDSSGFSLSENEMATRPPSNVSAVLNSYIVKNEQKKKARKNNEIDSDSSFCCTETSNISSILNFCFNNNQNSNADDELEKSLKSFSFDKESDRHSLKTPSPTSDQDPTFIDCYNYLDLSYGEIRTPFSDVAVNDEQHNSTNSDENDHSSQSSKIKRSKIKSKKGYTCEICSVTYSKFSALLYHDGTTHSSYERNVACPICGRLFIKESRLEVHILKHGEKKFKCHICQKMFLTDASLRAHQVIHTGIYQCNKCDYRASSKTIIREHELRHIQVKSFECDCGKSFGSSWALSRHKKNHDMVSDSFKCEVCQMVFKEYFQMKTHSELHKTSNEFMCEKCALICTSRKSLINHIKRHDGPQHICVECSKKYYSRYELAVHSKIHTRVKDFICDKCNRPFGYKHSLKRHTCVRRKKGATLSALK